MLVSAERLHRWKCKFCGSKDKNISSGFIPKSSTDTKLEEAIKVVACNQCGHVEIFAHSARVLTHLISGNRNLITIEDSENFVKNFHELNHIDPKINPHNEIAMNDALRKDNKNT